MHCKNITMISYFTESVKFVFKGKAFNNSWLRMVAGSESFRIGDLSIVFCSDPYIRDVNMMYLQHDYFTDLITFDYCDGRVLSGDLMISIDTVKANAEEYGATFEEELNRVMVHGLLHLMGYDDHTEEEKQIMRGKENYYLEMRKQLRG